MRSTNATDQNLLELLFKEFDRTKMDFDPHNWGIILGWNEKVKRYKEPVYTFKVEVQRN